MKGSLSATATYPLRAGPVLQVFVDGVLRAELDRNKQPTTVQLRHSAATPGGGEHVLDVLVSAMGRLNFGCGWDVKGLTSPSVTLDGALTVSGLGFKCSLQRSRVLIFASDDKGPYMRMLSFVGSRGLLGWKLQASRLYIGSYNYTDMFV